MTRAGRVALTVALAALPPGACRGGGEPEVLPAPTTVPKYALAATLQCLESRGAGLAPPGPEDGDRLQALGDLAQRGAMAVRADGALVGLAVTPDAEAARLLADLLAVPDDPYMIERRGNAVVLYRPAEAGAFEVVVGCLRP